jgi:hypothetical protein
MLCNYDLSTLESAIFNAKTTNSFELLESYLVEQKNKNNERFAEVDWNTDKIESVRPFWPKELLLEGGKCIADNFVGRLEDEAREIIDVALDCGFEKRNSHKVLMHIAKVLLEIVGKETLLAFKNFEEFVETSLDSINKSDMFETEWEGYQVKVYLKRIWDNLETLKE